MSISRVDPKQQEVEPLKPSVTADTPRTVDIEPPYTSYEGEKHHSYLVDHYELGESKDLFENEIKTIDGYFKDQAEHGKIDNKLSTIKSLIAKYEKMANIGKEERTVMKIAKLSAFVKFLRESEHINSEVSRYG